MYIDLMGFGRLDGLTESLSIAFVLINTSRYLFYFRFEKKEYQKSLHDACTTQGQCVKSF